MAKIRVTKVASYALTFTLKDQDLDWVREGEARTQCHEIIRSSRMTQER
jgi:hypothetical protein